MSGSVLTVKGVLCHAQAVEAKEGVEIQNETITLASISYQNFFRSYPVSDIPPNTLTHTMLCSPHAYHAL